jgi:hypothetical protein
VPTNLQNILLTVTEIGMLAYWLLATALVLKLVHIPPAYMYSDYLNPLIAAWNWSFAPVDVLFALCGLAASYAPLSPARRQMLLLTSLALMFCAGLMAVSFWAIRGEFDAFWWGMNLWLMILPVWVFVRLWRAPG